MGVATRSGDVEGTKSKGLQVLARPIKALIEKRHRGRFRRSFRLQSKRKAKAIRGTAPALLHLELQQGAFADLS